MGKTIRFNEKGGAQNNQKFARQQKLRNNRIKTIEEKHSFFIVEMAEPNEKERSR